MTLINTAIKTYSICNSSNWKTVNCKAMKIKTIMAMMTRMIMEEMTTRMTSRTMMIMSEITHSKFFI